MARPTKYNREFHTPWARSLAKQGLTVKEIAKEMGLSKTTLNNWMKAHEEFMVALNEGRSYADSIVEDSLYKLAIGTTVKETRRNIVYDEHGNPSPKDVEVVEKETPPNATACIFWLKNRNPKRWRDKPGVEVEDLRPVVNITVPAAKVEN